MAEPEHFDVFLCHNSEDKSQIKIIARQLRENSIIPWLDEDKFIGGDEWQKKLYKIINKTSIAFIFLGNHGIGKWQHEEIDHLHTRFIKNGRVYPIIVPVLLPGVKEVPDEVKDYLNKFQRISITDINDINKFLKIFHKVDYYQLEELLIQEKWKEANEETNRVILQIANKEQESDLTTEDIKKIPCVDLQAINQLWKDSNENFGLSVQKQIYFDCGAKPNYKYPGDEIWDNFCDQVGWREKGNWVHDNQLTYNNSARKGHLPRLKEKKRMLYCRLHYCD